MSTNPDFTKKLLKWNKDKNSRPMPWKGEKDPYRIWLSEIILQQTRVEQGWNYYERFITVFPDIFSLAKAPEKDVFKLWEGLGYYSRCRNLIATARVIVDKYNGIFPGSYAAILDLKGIGPYTAAAIASFAFDLPYAVVDGNVQRVLSRYCGINTPSDTGAGKKYYAELAQAFLDKKQPGIYNQAIMDFGATICKPQPACQLCVQQSDCVAFKHGWTQTLPVKTKTIVKKTRWIYYFLIENSNGELYIRKRETKDIWRQLYEFILWETDYPVEMDKKSISAFTRKIFGTEMLELTSISPVYKQQLTHQLIQGQFLSLRLPGSSPSIPGYFPVQRKKLRDYPFPRFINGYLQSPVQQLF